MFYHVISRYFKTFEAQPMSQLISELKSFHPPLPLSEKPFFLKTNFIADSAFLTNYQKISKHIHFPEKAENLKDPLFPRSIIGLTPENVCDVHVNSKKYYPVHMDMKFSGFGEMNKEKSNAQNLLLKTNLGIFEYKQL